MCAILKRALSVAAIVPAVFEIRNKQDKRPSGDHAPSVARFALPGTSFRLLSVFPVSQPAATTQAESPAECRATILLPSGTFARRASDSPVFEVLQTSV